MKNTRTITLLTGVGLVMGSTLASTAAPKNKPNVIFFLMDDMGYGDVGFQGQQKIETPNIDALAATGKILTSHYSGSPVSAPSRCVLLTGLHTGHAQIRGNDEQDERGDVWSFQGMTDDPSLEGQRPMDSTTRTLAHAFQAAGYTTACIGKWGLGAPGSASEPNRMGFDFFYGYNCQRISHTYYPPFLYKNRVREYLDNGVHSPMVSLGKDKDPLDERSYDEYQQKIYAPDRMFEETIDFIDANKTKPFFMWWTTPMPHAALQAPKELVDYYHKKFGDEKPYLGGSYFPVRYPHATYAAMVTYIDQKIGAIIDKLKSDGIYENTVIVFTSDNGPSCEGGSDSPYFYGARPFRSDWGWGKTSVMEGGLRVPTCVSWPGQIKAGSRSDMVSGFQDWWPTLLELTGAKTKNSQSALDGVSLVPTLTGKGKQQEHDYLYWEYPDRGGMVAVRQGEWKMVVKNVSKTPTFALYDLKADPTEKHDLSDVNPTKLAELKSVAAQSHVEPSNPLFRMGLPLK
ncbi:MAG: arylsulfatase [Mucinivorans sp.]